MLVGIPLGSRWRSRRTFYGITFPVFEVLRPIPPLAWVPAAIIFWPTQELSIAFVTFLGAFFTIVINVIGGAKSIDVRYFQAARSMGSSTFDIFRRIILPGVLPSIVVSATVGIGITWAVVVAAEMISGGGSAGSMGGAAGGGLGFFIWNSYVGGSYTQIVAGMITGVAGYMSSAILRKIGQCSLPGSRKAERAMQMFHAKVSALAHSTPRALGSQVVVSNVSKSYGADAFAKQVVHNCSFMIAVAN